MFVIGSYIGVVIRVAWHLARLHPKATAALVVVLLVVGAFSSATHINVFTSPDKMFATPPAPRPVVVGCNWMDNPSRHDCPPGVPNGSTIIYVSGGKVFYR